jgi:hypothetical protein
MAKTPHCAPRHGNSALVAHGCLGPCGAIHRYAHYKHSLIHYFQAENSENTA